ncbi:hypothetical protein Tco_0894682 [Tanacetum coccineum]|uniref:Reverse transcriptase domain-containing protein n=1 Tax=Tanacetum coccineum TaxID=301880 RepID=A0ABQ5CCE3_9ASTR
MGSWVEGECKRTVAVQASTINWVLVDLPTVAKLPSRIKVPHGDQVAFNKDEEAFNVDVTTLYRSMIGKLQKLLNLNAVKRIFKYLNEANPPWDYGILGFTLLIWEAFPIGTMWFSNLGQEIYNRYYLVLKTVKEDQLGHGKESARCHSLIGCNLVVSNDDAVYLLDLISHVQIPQPPPQPSSVQPTDITPPTQPVQTTSPPPVSSIPEIQPTQPPSPQIPSPSFHDTEEQRKRLQEKHWQLNLTTFKRLTADQRILAEKKVNAKEREQYSIEERAKFLHDTIAAQRKFLAEQRSAIIRNKPPTVSQLRNQMITYQNMSANRSMLRLKSKSFEEIQNCSSLTREDDDLKICLHIAPDEDKVIDVESLDHQHPIIEWQSFFLTTKPQHDQTKPDEDIYLNKVTRSNGHQRFFRTLMGVLSILDREDLKVIYELVMEEYKDRLPEGFDRDALEIYDFSSGVHTIMTSTGLVFHMLVESRYPLTKEVLSQMLELKLETEEESSMALELIKFVKQQLEEFEDSNDDDHGEEERVFVFLSYPQMTYNKLEELVGCNSDEDFDESSKGFWSKRLRSCYLLRACPHHAFIQLHQLDTFYNALNLADQDSLNSVARGNLLKRRTQDVLTIIENKSKVRNSQNKSIISQVKSSDVNSSSSSEISKLTNAVNQQTSDVTTTMTAILKQFQATPPPASVKAVEEICVTCGGAHPYYQCLAADGNIFSKFRDNIQGYVLAATVNYNQGNFGYRPPSVANQIQPPNFAQPNV